MSATHAYRPVTGDWKTLGKDAGAIRTEVFVREQNIPIDLEWDSWDDRSLHCVAYLDGQPVGTGRLLPDGHIGRMAVLPAHRRTGLGGLVLRTLIDAAAARGHLEVELSAQAYVAQFYMRHGFAPEGDPYDEVGIPHLRMRRTLMLRDETDARMDDGTRVKVRDWRPFAGQGRGVYLLHGLGEHSGRYEALARWFAARGWRVQAHDHVGHGASDGARGVVVRPRQMLEHARQRIDGFAGELGARPLLLGHSMGGALAAQLVLSGSVEVGGLVLSSPALDLGLSGFQRFLMSTLERFAPALAVGNGLNPDMISHDPAIVRAYRDDPLVHDRVSARLLRWLLDAGSESIEGAARLAVPTLLLVAGADRLVRPQGSRSFAERAPAERLTLHWYETMYHELFNEQAADRERVLADLGAWLERARESAD